MNLHEKINADMVSAMKSRQKDVVDFLRVVMGEFGRIGKELSDEQVIPILKKMLQNAKDLGNDFEVLILEKYLPQMYGVNEIKLIVISIIQHRGFSGMKDMGKVMTEIKNHPNSIQIDGKLASGIVKDMLS